MEIYAIINKIFNEDSKDWRMFATEIEDRKLGDIVSLSIEYVSDVCICMKVVCIFQFHYCSHKEYS
jgi:hypothetical protein